MRAGGWELQRGDQDQAGRVSGHRPDKRYVHAGAETLAGPGPGTVGLRASASGAAYTASKHALVGYTKSVAFFYGPQGIRANVVAPGSVQTNIEASVKSDFAIGRIMPIIQAIQPVRAQPEHLAAAITWLLGDDSPNINGAVLPSDGGWSTA